MKVAGVHRRAVAPAPDGQSVVAIDQTRLPHEVAFARLVTLEDAADAIRRMVVRGAPLIGATAAYGVWLAMREDPSDAGLARAVEVLRATRPTAVNLRWALEAMRTDLSRVAPAARAAAARDRADAVADEDVAVNTAIGRHGRPLIERAFEAKGRRDPVNVLTHCNAGWLATVDVGTALAPVYAAFDAGVPVHVWVDETRPRGQGARLTAWELREHGVPLTVVADNAGGHLMQHGQVDLCIVGTDRTTASGDVANKIGTYLKALAAKDSGVPFHVALPSSTVDWTIEDGLRDVPIEERDPREVTHVEGRAADGRLVEVELTPAGVAAANPGFDVTPARLVTSLITERGVCPATKEGLRSLFPERRPAGARP